MTKPTGTQIVGRWLSVRIAAGHLGISPDALRRRLERNVQVGEDGVVEAEVDGIRGRKWGRTWRVWLGPGWEGTHKLERGGGET